MVGRRVGIFIFTCPIDPRNSPTDPLVSWTLLPGSTGEGAVLFTGTIVDYEARTGLHRLSFDCEVPQEVRRGIDEQGEDAEGVWIHVALCHVDLNVNADVHRRTGTCLPGQKVGRDAAAEMVQRGLGGPFRGCLKVRPGANGLMLLI